MISLQLMTPNLSKTSSMDAGIIEDFIKYLNEHHIYFIMSLFQTH